jgi:hypothetical protein
VTIQFSMNGNTVTGIKWSIWNSAIARGIGSWAANNCVPTCARGKVNNYTATVTLTNPSRGQFHTLQETQSGPLGKTYTYTLPNPDLAAS